MNRKTIIQLTVIVVAFGVAGIVIYNGFFKKGPTPPSIIAQVPATGAGVGTVPVLPGQDNSSSSKFLPLGGNVDEMFKILYKQNLKYGYKYPQVDMKTEVGKAETQLLLPASSAPPAAGR